MNKARSEQTLKALFTKAMNEPDLKSRLSKLDNIALSICWHGETWDKAVEAARELRKQGVTTYLQDALNRA